MKIAIVPNAYKGTLSAAVAAGALAAGVRCGLPDATISTQPLADGGEGTLAALQSHLADVISVDHEGGQFLMFNDSGQRAALIESAQYIGLHSSAMTAYPVALRGSGAPGGAA